MRYRYNRNPTNLLAILPAGVALVKGTAELRATATVDAEGTPVDGAHADEDGERTPVVAELRREGKNGSISVVEGRLTERPEPAEIVTPWLLRQKSSMLLMAGARFT